MTAKTSGETEPVDVFARAVEAQQTLTAMVWHFNATVLSEATALNGELMDFAQRRLKEDVAVAAELGRCGTVEKAMETLASFQQQALEDYTSEAAKLAALNTHAGDALVAEVTGDAEAIAREVGRQAA